MLCEDGGPTESWTRRRSRRRWRYWAAMSIEASVPRWQRNTWPANTVFTPDGRRWGWIVKGKLWRGRPQRIDQIHQWRPRRSRVGELVQWDTSEHAWLEDRGPKLYLISMI